MILEYSERELSKFLDDEKRSLDIYDYEYEKRERKK